MTVGDLGWPQMTFGGVGNAIFYSNCPQVSYTIYTMESGTNVSCLADMIHSYRFPWNGNLGGGVPFPERKSVPGTHRNRTPQVQTTYREQSR